MAEQGGETLSTPEKARQESDDVILRRLAQAAGGVVPPPLRLMSRRPGTVTTFVAHKDQVMSQGPLTAKEQALIALAAAVVIRSPVCIRVHASAARQAGAAEAEIVQAALIAGLVCGASPLRTAAEAICPE
jgi:AhpD family alkylhydroperoxidase